jgi:hypothetical protein
MGETVVFMLPVYPPRASKTGGRKNAWPFFISPAGKTSTTDYTDNTDKKTAALPWKEGVSERGCRSYGFSFIRVIRVIRGCSSFVLG